MWALHTNVLSDFRYVERGQPYKSEKIGQKKNSTRHMTTGHDLSVMGASRTSYQCIKKTYFLRKLALALVSVLSVRSSRSRSVVEELRDRPRVSLVWVLLSLLGPGVVADPVVT